MSAVRLGPVTSERKRVWAGPSTERRAGRSGRSRAGSTRATWTWGRVAASRSSTASAADASVPVLAMA